MTPVSPPNATAASWLMIAALGLIWGATFLGIELALKGMTPFWLASGRIVFAALLMLVIWGARGFGLFTEPARGGDWALLGVIGATSTAIPFMLLSWGQQFVTSGFAGVSMAAVALIVLPLAHVMVPGERLSVRKSLGFAVGFTGVVVLIGDQVFASTGVALEFAGRLACLGAAGCYAFSSVAIRRLPPLDPIGLACILLVIGAVIVVPAALVVEGIPDRPPADALTALVILALIPTAGANLLRILVIRSAGPTFMSLTNYQVPVWSVFLGWLLLAEPLPPSLLGALVLILAGVALSQWHILRNLFAKPLA